MFLSREIDIKLCQNYTKMYIYEILYKNRRFKQIIFSKYAITLFFSKNIYFVINCTSQYGRKWPKTKQSNPAKKFHFTDKKMSLQPLTGYSFTADIK